MLMRVKQRYRKAPVYNGAMPPRPNVDTVRMLDELREVVHIQHLSMRMGWAERTLEEVIRYGTGRCKRLSYHDWCVLLALHRKFYPQGTEGYPL